MTTVTADTPHTPGSTVRLSTSGLERLIAERRSWRRFEKTPTAGDYIVKEVLLAEDGWYVSLKGVYWYDQESPIFHDWYPAHVFELVVKAPLPRVKYTEQETSLSKERKEAVLENLSKAY